MLQLKPYFLAKAGMANALSLTRISSAALASVIVRIFFTVFTGPSSLWESRRWNRLNCRNLGIEAVEGPNEGHQRFLLLRTQAERHNQGIEIRTVEVLAAAVVELDERFERGLRAVVQIRSAQRRVAHGGSLEGAHVARVLRHDVAALIGVLEIFFYDADVVETAVAEVGAPVACRAVSLAVEDLKSLLLQRGQRAVVSTHVAIEARVGGDDGSLEGGDRVGYLLHGHRAFAEHAHEGIDVTRDGVQRVDHHFVRVAHLDRVLDRPFGLLLERGRASVPELQRVVGGIRNRRRPASAHLASDALAGRPGVGPPFGRVVAGGAADGVIARETRIEVELLPEMDLRA